MKNTLSSAGLSLIALGSLALAGCHSTTTIRLTGTPDTQVYGHYRADDLSTDFKGAADWHLQLEDRRLHVFEFRKTAPDQPVSLEIRRGRKNLVKATAEPGTSGLRVRAADGWKVETLK